MEGETAGFSGDVVLSFRWFLEGTANWALIWPQRLTLRKERRLRVLENRVLRGVFGAERDGVTAGWKIRHNEQLNDLYCSPNIVRVIKSGRMRWAGHVARMGEGSGIYTVLVGKPDGKRPIGRQRRRWKDKIRMDLQEVGCWGMDWIEPAQDRDS